jgi:hypothetical protein
MADNVPAEETQEQGRQGVEAVKRWLESTVRFEVRYSVYTHAVRTTLQTAAGSKRFDLRGTHFNEDYQDPVEIYIEVKNYTSDEGLATEWIDFVANSYSATHLEWDRIGRDPMWEFMFASTHPWSPTKYWTATDPAAVRTACEARPGLIPATGLIDERISTVSQRLFLWLISKRQDDMTMAKRFRGMVIGNIEGG